MDKPSRKAISKKPAAFRQCFDKKLDPGWKSSGCQSSFGAQSEGSVGGLRDYHHILWRAKVFFGLRVPRDLEYSGKFSHQEYLDLKHALHFIWAVRNHLHQICRRRNDR